MITRTSRLELAARALLCLLVFTLPFEKAVQLPGLGTISRTVGFAAFAAGFAALWQRGRLRTPNLPLILAAAFTVWSALTWFWSAAPPATAIRAATLAQLLAMLWLIWEVCRDEALELRLLEAYLAGAALSSVWTIVRAAHNQQTYYRRFATAGFDPNDLGVTLALALPMALYLSGRHRGAAAWLVRLGAVLAIVGILLTASRTAWIAACVSFVFAIATWRRARPAERITGVALLAILILGTVRLAPSGSRQRLATLPSEVAHGTFHNRTRIWKTGIKLLKRRGIAGVGAGAYPWAVEPWLGWSPIPEQPYTAHNTFLSVLVETGAVGAALFGSLLAALALFVWMLDPGRRALWFTALAVWTAGVSTLSWESRKPTWLIFALIVVAWARSWRTETSR